MSSNVDLLRKEFAALRFLVNGRISFRVTVPREMSAAETSEIGVTPKFYAIRTNGFIREGLISGFVPILTEKGKATWDALRAIYEEDGY